MTRAKIKLISGVFSILMGLLVLAWDLVIVAGVEKNRPRALFEEFRPDQHGDAFKALFERTKAIQLQLADARVANFAFVSGILIAAGVIQVASSRRICE